MCHSAMPRRNTCCWKKPGVFSPTPIWPTTWTQLVSSAAHRKCRASLARGEGAPLSWRPSADAVAGEHIVFARDLAESTGYGLPPSCTSSLILSSKQMQPPVVGQEDIGGIAFLAERHEVVPPWILRLQIVGPLLMVVVGQELAPVQAERNVVRAKQLPEAAEETILSIGDTGIVDVP